MGKITRQEFSENLNNEIDTIQEDIDTLDTNLNLVDTTVLSHLAESANKHIHSSGENWIRFDDGTQICYASFQVDDILEFGSGTYSDPYRSASIRFGYPASFVSLPTVTTSCESSEATSYHRAVVPIIHTTTAKGCDTQVFRITSSGADISVTVHVQAIGRWK